MRDLQRAQDGTEINARDLELLTEKAQNLGDRREAIAEQYRAKTDDVWRPRRWRTISISTAAD